MLISDKRHPLFNEKMILRDYQKNCIQAILSDQKSQDRSLCVLDTGLGKTVIFVSLIEQCLELKPTLRILIAVRDVVLVKQTVEAFNISDVDFVCSSLGKKEISFNTPVQVATLQTLIKKESIPFFNLIIVDECDSISDRELKFLNQLKVKIVGFTATPYDNYGFIYPDVWPKPCFQATKETVDKYLCPITLKGSNESIDTSGIAKSGQEYNLQSASKKYTPEIIIKQAKDIFKKIHGRKKVVIVCCNIDHANQVHSVMGGSITHSKLSKKDQQENLLRFIGSNERFLITVNQIARGFNHPPIDCIVLLRPIRSYSLMKQIVGRGRRLSEGKKDVLILDYGNVFNELGMPEDIEKNLQTKNRDLKYKLCPMCETFIQKSIYTCDCGFEFIKFEGDKRNGDIFKKQTYKSYNGIYQITDIKVFDHVSKNGNVCLKLLFFSGLAVVHTAYLMPFNVKTYSKKIFGKSVDSFSEFKKLRGIKVSHVELKKDGKYKKIHKWFTEGSLPS